MKSRKTTLKKILAWLVACFGVMMMAYAEPALQDRYFTTSDGVRLHYLEGGSGKTMVFVPGWTMPAEIWLPQLAYFSRKFRVIALDPRAQGESEIASSGYEPKRRAEDIHELIQASGADSVVLVGWSLGVLESLAYINFHGDQHLDALVLVDNSIGEDPPPPPSNFLKRLRQNREETISAFVKSMYKTPQPDAYLDKLIRVSLKTPLKESIALLSYSYPREFWRNSVYSTKKPVLYAVSPRFKGQSENFKKKRPAATVELFENAGHALFVDEAERFNALLEKFLDDNLTR